MDKEKQIEEMAKYTCYPCEMHVGDGVCAVCNDYRTCRLSLTTAVNLYNAGYRKQSENTVEVVRCKDCKYLERTDCFGECSLWNEWGEPHGEMSPNDFCSYGERRK